MKINFVTDPFFTFRAQAICRYCLKDVRYELWKAAATRRYQEATESGALHMREDQLRWLLNIANSVEGMAA